MFFAHESMKKSPQKVNTLGEFQKIFPTTKTVEFMFSNMAYRATLYSTGSGSKVTAINYVLSG